MNKKSIFGSELKEMRWVTFNLFIVLFYEGKTSKCPRLKKFDLPCTARHVNVQCVWLLHHSVLAKAADMIS